MLHMHIKATDNNSQPNSICTIISDITTGLHICMIILGPITKERQILRQKYKTNKALYYELKSLANIYQQIPTMEKVTKTWKNDKIIANKSWGLFFFILEQPFAP